MLCLPPPSYQGHSPCKLVLGWETDSPGLITNTADPCQEPHPPANGSGGCGQGHPPAPVLFVFSFPTSRSLRHPLRRSRTRGGTGKVCGVSRWKPEAVLLSMGQGKNWPRCRGFRRTEHHVTLVWNPGASASILGPFYHSAGTGKPLLSVFWCHGRLSILSVPSPPSQAREPPLRRPEGQQTGHLVPGPGCLLCNHGRAIPPLGPQLGY